MSTDLLVYIIQTSILLGSEQPEIPDDGKLRLYAMRFCPFAHRVHLALYAKNIPHHVINIDLTNKPEWYSKVNPNGKVPSLHLVNEPGKPFLYESLVLAEYLDDKYPEPALYPNDPLEKAQAKLLIEKLAAVFGSHYRLVYDPSLEKIDQTFDEFHNHLDVFETELKNKNTLYFGGEKPNIVDYALWPWAERFHIIEAIYGDKYKLNETNYPLLVKQTHILYKNS